MWVLSLTVSLSPSTKTNNEKLFQTVHQIEIDTTARWPKIGYSFRSFSTKNAIVWFKVFLTFQTIERMFVSVYACDVHNTDACIVDISLDEESFIQSCELLCSYILTFFQGKHADRKMERKQKCALSDCIHIRGVEIWIHIDRIASQISSLKCFPITIDCAFFVQLLGSICMWSLTAIPMFFPLTSAISVCMAVLVLLCYYRRLHERFWNFNTFECMQKFKWTKHTEKLCHLPLDGAVKQDGLLDWLFKIEERKNI